MNLLNGIELFVKAIDSGSFSEVGRQLHVAPSSISRKINALEEELGVRLLQRTTRHLSLTEAGEVYYELVSEVLKSLDEAQLAITQLQATPKGTLRLNVAIPLGEHNIVPLLPEFLGLYPELKIDLTLEDQAIDLVEKRVDLSIRVGVLNDSSIVARKLAENNYVICGSPQYFDTHGIPETPSELAQHNCIINKNIYSGNVWQFTKGEDIENISVTGNFQANTGGALYNAIISHLGVSALPTWFVGQDISQGRLLRVLDNYEIDLPAMADSAIYALYPAGQYLSPKVRVFIDYLVEKLSLHAEADIKLGLK